MKNYNKMEYLLGKRQDFLDYLNNLKKKDKIAVISHADLDGIASAILIKEILKQKKLKINSISFIEYGKGMFEKTEKNFKKQINKIIISDINVDADSEGFYNLKEKYDLFVIDHHPSELKSNNLIKTKTEDCATFAIYNLGKEKFDLTKWKWIVYATMISEFSFKDKSNFEFIKNHYPTISLEDIYNSEPAEISKKISSALICHKGKEEKVFNLIFKGKLKRLSKYHKIIETEIKEWIEKFKKEAEFYPEKNLYFYYGNPEHSISSTIATSLSVKEPDKSFVFVSGIKEEPDFVKVSSRNNGKIEDMNLLMKKGIEGLKNANGGGHIPAAAARFMKKDLEKFKENILR